MMRCAFSAFIHIFVNDRGWNRVSYPDNSSHQVPEGQTVPRIFQSHTPPSTPRLLHASPVINPPLPLQHRCSCFRLTCTHKEELQSAALPVCSSVPAHPPEPSFIHSSIQVFPSCLPLCAHAELKYSRFRHRPSMGMMRCNSRRSDTSASTLGPCPTPVQPLQCPRSAVHPPASTSRRSCLPCNSAKPLAPNDGGMVRGGNERECCFCLPAGCAGGEGDVSALPSSFPDQGKTRTVAPEQKQSKRRRKDADVDGRLGRRGQTNEAGIVKLLVLSSVVFGGTPLSL